jgi:hypothetical protein
LFSHFVVIFVFICSWYFSHIDTFSPLSHLSSKTQTISRMASVPFRFWKYVHLFYKRNITGERGRLSRDRMVVGFTTACTISAYQHYESCELESRSWRVVLNTTLCDKVCQWLATRRWFTVDTPVSSTSNSDRHDITEILLKVVLNTITVLNGESRGATTSLNI